MLYTYIWKHIFYFRFYISHFVCADFLHIYDISFRFGYKILYDGVDDGLVL